MLCFAMLLTPAVALGGPRTFGQRRAHTLFWTVRSAQLSRLDERLARRAGGDAHAQGRAAQPQAPRFHCRQLEPSDDRQPLTTRAAKRTRADGEALAASVGEDVGGAEAWRRLALDVAPRQLLQIARLYSQMPKESPTKLRLLI